MRPWLIVFCCCLTGATCPAADSTIVDTAFSEPDSALIIQEEARPDTVVYRPQGRLSAYAPAFDSTNYERRLYQNPTVALFRSMVAPGWGQLGNRRYLKAVVFAGLQTWMIGSAIHYGRQAADHKEQFEQAETVAARNDWYGVYEDRRDERNKFTWFAAIVAFVAMFDAYVDAHLSGFPDASAEKISLDVRPDREGGMQALLTMPF